jgi:hypothetical protein
MQSPTGEIRNAPALRDRIIKFVYSIKDYAENVSGFLNGPNVCPEKLKAAEQSLEKRFDLLCERVIEYIKFSFIEEPKQLTAEQTLAMNQAMRIAISEFYCLTNDHAYRSQAVAGFLTLGRFLVSASGLYANNKEVKMAALDTAADKLIDAIDQRVTMLNNVHKSPQHQVKHPYYTRSAP